MDTENTEQSDANIQAHYVRAVERIDAWEKEIDKQIAKEGESLWPVNLQ